MRVTILRLEHVHNNSTKNKCNVFIEALRTSMFSNQPIYAGITLYNSLSQTIGDINELKPFESSLRHFLLILGCPYNPRKNCTWGLIKNTTYIRVMYITSYRLSHQNNIQTIPFIYLVM